MLVVEECDRTRVVRSLLLECEHFARRTKGDEISDWHLGMGEVREGEGGGVFDPTVTNQTQWVLPELKHAN